MVKVNVGQRSANVLVNDDVSRWRGSGVSKWRGGDDVIRANVSKRYWRVTARGGVWRRVEDPGGAWRRVERVRSCAEFSGGAWGRMAAPMMVRFPRAVRSSEEDLSGTCKNTIGARITAATLWQWSRDYEWRQLQVRNQRRWLKRVRGLVANGCSSSCKGGSNCESKIILMERTAKKKSEWWLWYHVRNTERLYSIFSIKEYTSVPYIGGISVRYK